MDLFGDGPVLDQLQHVVAENHRTFGGAQALADFEGAHVDLARHAAVVYQVLGQVGEAVEQALATGLEEAFDGGGVGRAVGRGHGFGHQVDHEVPAVDVLLRQVAVADPVVELLAPGQVGLQVAFVERVLAPGRIVEATVIAFGLQLGFAKHHILQLEAEMGHVLDAVDGLFDGLGQHHAGRSKQIFAAQADDRIEPQGVFRGLAFQVIVILVTHLRRSIVLRRVPEACCVVTQPMPGTTARVTVNCTSLTFYIRERCTELASSIGYPSLIFFASGPMTGPGREHSSR